jgi:hypothetical protein
MTDMLDLLCSFRFRLANLSDPLRLNSDLLESGKPDVGFSTLVQKNLADTRPNPLGVARTGSTRRKP